MPYTIERYTPETAALWDDFTGRAKNATFLMRRGYMDYHADRFTDFSLVARDDKGRIVALLPANAAGDRIESHGGLTYGGWIGGYRHFDVLSLLEIHREASRFLAARGFREMLYKPLPYIYAALPSEEDRYMIFRSGGRLAASQVSTVIDLCSDMGPDATRRRKVRNSVRLGVTVRESTDMASFWRILEEVLADRHGASPVHTLDEISMLCGRFPDNMRLMAAFEGAEMIAGTLLYIAPPVVHAQYIAGGARSLELDAVNLLLVEAVEWSRIRGFRWFDFGTSNEQSGRVLNEGLVRQKITLGGRAVTYDQYIIPIT